MGVLLVYDVTDQKSYESKSTQIGILIAKDITTWIHNLEQHASTNINKVLIGNKTDLVDRRVPSLLLFTECAR